MEVSKAVDSEKYGFRYSNEVILIARYEVLGLSGFRFSQFIRRFFFGKFSQKLKTFHRCFGGKNQASSYVMKFFKNQFL